MRFDWNDVGWLVTLTVCWLFVADRAPDVDEQPADKNSSRQTTTDTGSSTSEKVPDEKVPIGASSGTTSSSTAPQSVARSAQTATVEPSQPSPSDINLDENLERLLSASSTLRIRDQAFETNETPKDWSTPPGVVCRCRGQSSGQCLCLRAGTKCQCSANTGSVWRKTGEKLKLDTEQIPFQSQTTAGYPVTVQGTWAYWTAHGVQWNNQGSGVRENQVYGLPGSRQFIYRRGRMYDYPETSASPPNKAASGQASASSSQRWGWVQRCDGRRCYWSWEPLP